MKLGEKLKEERLKLGLTEAVVAKQLNIALNKYIKFENSEKYPLTKEIFIRLAEILQVDIDYLLTDAERFNIYIYEKYGSKAVREINAFIDNSTSSEELCDGDKIAVAQSLRQLYLDAKIENKKYTPKKYLV